MFVIKKNQYYVARKGHNNSYTSKLKFARKFTTLEDAKREKCGNEYIVSYYYERDNE